MIFGAMTCGVSALLMASPSLPAELTVSIPTLSDEGARIALDAAEREASGQGLRVSIAVVDAWGNLLAFRRLGQAMPASIDNAIAKARTAAQLGAPSGMVQNLVDGGSPSLLAVTGISPLQGGVPIVVEGRIVGGIASSGVTSELDERVARSGADAVRP